MCVCRYVKMLRKTLDDAGFHRTRIVAKDAGWDICDKLAADPEYAQAVDVIGLHYPTDFHSYAGCHALGTLVLIHPNHHSPKSYSDPYEPKL